MSPKWIHAVGILAAGVCGSTGLVYATTVETNLVEGPPAAVVLTLGMLGAALIATAATWQADTKRGRDLPLAILAALATGYVIGNVAGMTLFGLIERLRAIAEPGLAMRVMLWVGLLIGTALTGVTLLEILRIHRADRPTEDTAR